MARLGVVILAAGQGTRIKSDLPKVLHPVCGRPMIMWSVRAARALCPDNIVVVVGTGADRVRETVGPDVTYALQAEPLGTGHAVLQARHALEGRADTLLVLYGDMPALRSETLQQLIDLHCRARPTITILTVTSDDSMGFGRVVRDAEGHVLRVVEEAVATPQILALRELNCGVYCFDAQWLWEHLPQIPVTQPKGEFYLTDTLGLASGQGRRIETLVIDDVTEVQGINTRVHLARSERILRDRLNERLMLEGVTLIDPATTYVHADVRVGRDTVIHPNTYLQGDTVIGAACELGPNTVIRDSRIHDGCQVVASVVEGAVMEEGCRIGPFGHLRPGAHLGAGVHMGNYGEVKNAHLGSGTKMGHFAYVGDAEVGPNANIGAGTVTCNYDGERKHRTVIGEGAFVGSGTMLVAPVSVGRGAKIGAGSVVTHDVPDGALVYGVPARPRGRSREDCEDQDA